MYVIVIDGPEPNTTVVVSTDSDETRRVFREMFSESILLDYEHSDGRVETN